MKSEHQRRVDTILVAFTAIVLFALAGFAILAIQRNLKVAETHLEQRLENEQKLARVSISSSAHELDEVLSLEGAWMSEWPALPTEALCVERWRPLLNDDRPWLKIGVADEYGNGISLQRSGDSLLLRITEEGSQSRPAELRMVAPHGLSSLEGILRTEQYDPRGRLWFSKALEDTRNTPIWTIGQNVDADLTRLQISLLLRPSKLDAPFRVIVLEADAERVPWLNKRSVNSSGEALLVLNNDGSILNNDLRTMDLELRGAMASAVALWSNKRPTGSFQVDHNGHAYIASFSPVVLNGQTIYSAIVLDTDKRIPILELQRRWLYLIAGLLFVLCILLGTLWARSRAVSAELLRKERKSRSQELRLAKALGEREVLNREVHHRVKNNLQVVSSLLNLQAAGMEKEEVRNEFIRGKQRIDTIALVHHKLYAMKDLREVDLDLFFNALAKATAETNHPKSHTVSFEVEANGLKCDQDTAIILGMIFCELMTNSFQHAFPYATGGHIDVLVQAVEGDLHRLVVKDNGQGLDPAAKDGNGKLGLEVVDALSDQLDGSFHMPPGGGTTFEVHFRMRSAESLDEPAGRETNGA